MRANVITEGQLKAALVEQQKWGGKLGAILVRMSFCTEDIVIKALSKQLALPRADLENFTPPPESVLRKIPLELSRTLDVVPLQLKDEGKTLVVAVSDPHNIEIIDTLRAKTGCKIVTMIAGPGALNKVRGQLYYGEETIDPGNEPELKLTDSQGRTVVKDIGALPVSGASAPRPPSHAKPFLQTPSEVLSAIENVQRKEVAILKTLVELLIEKGVFTREEYLARVKR